MSFSQYRTIEQTLQEFQIIYGEHDFVVAASRQPTDLFLADLAFNLEFFDPFASEGSRSELIILPILREVYKDYRDHCTIWVQKSFAVNQELAGTPDYIIATRSHLGKKVLGDPLLIVVEAKRDDFEQGWGQCLAQMVAAQMRNGTPTVPMYGIVTNASTWRIGRLLQNEFYQDTRSFDLDDLPELFGALHFTFCAALATLAH